MTLPQLFSAVVGSLFCIGSAVVFIRQRTRRFKALFWLAIGLAMVFAAFRPQLIELLGADSAELRLRLVVALISFIVVTVTLEAIRIARMQERYAFLWLVTGVLLFGGALSEDLAAIIARLTGMSYGATVMVCLFTFIMFMLFHISVALSRLQTQFAQVARELALAEERLRRLQDASPPPRAPEPPA